MPRRFVERPCTPSKRIAVSSTGVKARKPLVTISRNDPGAFRAISVRDRAYSDLRAGISRLSQPKMS